MRNENLMLTENVIVGSKLSYNYYLALVRFLKTKYYAKLH